MISQYEFYNIIKEKKFIEETIKIGGFEKQNFKISFENRELNKLNAYLDISKKWKYRNKTHYQ